MSELDIAEYFGIGEAAAIIATFLVTLYFSRREIHDLRVDLETKILNDLDDKLRGMGNMLVSQPQLVRILDRSFSERSPQSVFVFYVLYMCAHVFHMRERTVLSDNEWAGWLRWMRSAFEMGEISDYWKEKIEPGRWFDPSFQQFIDNEIAPYAKPNTRPN